MKNFFCSRKNIGKIILILLIAFLAGNYLFMLFSRGFHCNSAFLTKQSDGSYSGTAGKNTYRMVIDRDADTLTFSVNDITRHYQIFTDGSSARILQDGEEVFSGNVITVGNQTILTSGDSGLAPNISITTNGKTDPEHLFPDLLWIYNRVTTTQTDTRGNPVYLIGIIPLAISVTLMLLFPDLVWELSYRWYVDGGEPTDFYYSRLKFGVYVGIATIIVLMVLSFSIR